MVRRTIMNPDTYQVDPWSRGGLQTLGRVARALPRPEFPLRWNRWPADPTVIMFTCMCVGSWTERGLAA